jgi:NodT family efflux transporter outer membrane factor (OMF) lipoprotein
MRGRRTPARAALLFCLLLGLGACSVGPDFQRPGIPSSGTYVEANLPEQISATATDVGGQAQSIRASNDLIHDWWTLFHSEALNQLVATGLRDSPNLAAASASLRQAQEILTANRGNLLFPAVNLTGGATRERISGAELGLPTGSETLNLFNAQVGVSYTFDIFGSVRRQLEGLEAQVDYQQNELRAAQLALSANIVTAVVREAQLREQIKAYRDVEKLQRDGLTIVERRFELGAVTKTDVLSQRTALAQTIAAVAPLEIQRAQTRHLIAVYLGKAPSEIDLSAVEVSHLELPGELPVSLPSELVRQRPDILAAEDLLHAASAQVGVATANLYPQVTLGANYGYESLKASDLFKSGSAIWGLSANVTQPIFHGGALRAQKRAAEAAFDNAAATYRQTVLSAFANVADALRALEFDGQYLGAQFEAYQQAQAEVELAQRQFDVGAISQLSLLNAQQQFSQTAVLLAQARANRFTDTAALFEALGGGWWNVDAGKSPKPVASGS